MGEQQKIASDIMMELADDPIGTTMQIDFGASLEKYGILWCDICGFSVKGAFSVAKKIQDKIVLLSTENPYDVKAAVKKGFWGGIKVICRKCIQ